MLPFLIFTVPALLVGFVACLGWVRFCAWLDSPLSDIDRECDRLDLEWDEFDAHMRDERMEAA